MRPIFFLLTLALLGTAPAAARTESSDDERVNVFLDCDRCDSSYIRREIQFVDYVRDRDDADVHVLVTTRPTGSGGTTYSLDFIGRGSFESTDQRLTFSSGPDDTDDQERAGLVRVLKVGLMPYAARVGVADDFVVSYQPNEAPTLTPASDPWNSWVFRTNFGGYFRKESQQSRYDIDVSFAANRVTELWRFRSYSDYEYDQRSFVHETEEDGERISSTIVSTRREYGARASLVRSLSDHWSVGTFGSADSDTRFNNKLSIGLRPAIEYSVFPYEVAERKELTVAYSVGGSSRNYFDETVYLKTSELLAQQSLEVTLRLTQPWGEASARVQGSNYFHDLSFNRVDASGYVSVRLFRGLSGYLSVGAERIHDQLYLPRGDASLEDLLLQRRALATTYELDGSIGVTYTFGSIYNNVVNTRL